jgi:hypothetical protein
MTMTQAGYADRGLGSKGGHDQQASLTPSISPDEADYQPVG